MGGLGGSGRWNKYLWQAALVDEFSFLFPAQLRLVASFQLPVSRRLRERNLFQQCQSSIDERARPRGTLRPVIVRITLAAPSLPPSLRPIPITRPSPRRTYPSTLPWSATSPPTVRARAWAATTTRRSAATSSGGSSGGRLTPVCSTMPSRPRGLCPRPGWTRTFALVFVSTRSTRGESGLAGTS